MAKLVLNDVATFVNDASAVSLVSNNSAAIEAAMENTLSRNGASPNNMTADFDMNSNDILNVGNIDVEDITVAGVSLMTNVDAAAASAAAASASASSAAGDATSAAASAAAAATFNPINYVAYVTDTTEGIAALHVPEAVGSITTLGYHSAGDGGGAKWRRIATPSPVQPWQIQSADGSWWQLSPESFVNPRALGAKGDGANDDTVSCQGAIDLAASLAMEVYFPGGIYMVGTSVLGYGLQLNAPVPLYGPRRGVSQTAIIKLNAGVNGNVIQSGAFLDFPFVGDLTIDGNMANNTSGSGIKLSNRCMVLQRLMIQNVAEHALVTDKVGSAGLTPFEYTIDTLEIFNVGKDGWHFDGFSDAHVTNLIVSDCGQAADNTYFGVNFASGSVNGRFFNLHVWHNNGKTNRAAAAVNSFGGSQFTACHLEGARGGAILNGQNDMFANCRIYAPYNNTDGTSQVLVLNNSNNFVGCIFSSATAGGNPNVYAFQFGDATHPVAHTNVVGCQFQGYGYGTPFNFVNSVGYNQIIACQGVGDASGATAFAGTVNANDSIDYRQSVTTINYRKPWPYPSASSDSTAATAGVPIGGLYYNSTVKALTVRQS